jgi:hypothetical protein
MEQNNVTKTLSEQISEVIDQQRGFSRITVHLIMNIASNTCVP